ncbi:beta-ketoacyl synthase N-terminal-like domain-containing protein [Micromonosporaceae bacterium B7E4]
MRDGTSGPSPLCELLVRHATDRGDRLAYRFLSFDGTAEQTLTWAGLHRWSVGVARRVAEHARPGDRVLLVYDSGLGFLAGFFGCLLAGAVAVPAPPPRRPYQRTLPRLVGIQRDSEAKLVLADDAVRATLLTEVTADPSAAGLAAATWLAPQDCPPGDDDSGLLRGTAGDLAYLQYTSGSTAAAKGVAVSQPDVVANCAAMDAAWRHTPESVMVSWLPVFHDMGLVYGLMEPLCVGFPAVLMTPTAFVAQPVRWLAAHSEHGGTHTMAPNFGFDLCVRKVGTEDMARLDLSRWEVAGNASEPVRAATVQRFNAAFAPCGLRPGTLVGAYGLAEATLVVSASGAGQGSRIRPFRRDALAAGRAVPSADAAPPVPSADAASVDAAAVPMVSCGPPLPGFTIRIVDPHTGRLCQDEVIGEIWVAGPSIASGYDRHPTETAATFGARVADDGLDYLRTGDLGFVHDGELYVTGRHKDLLIFAGANHYPQDIEATSFEAHPTLRPGCAAAFAVDDGEEERLAVLQEVTDDAIAAGEAAEAITSIRAAVADTHGLRVDAVVLIRRGTVPKTSSGKIQRSAARDDFLAGKLAQVARWRSEHWPEPPAPRPAAEPVGTEPRSPAEPAGSGRRPSAERLAPARGGGAGNDEGLAGPVPAGDRAAPQVPVRRVARTGNGGPAELGRWLRRRVSALTGVAEPDIDDERPLAELGLSSAGAAELVGDLARFLGRPIPESLLYDHPTVTALAAACVGGPVEQRRRVTSVGETRTGAVAVVGIGCRLPGAAGPQAFWDLLWNGRDAIGPVPPSRWDRGAAPHLAEAGLVSYPGRFDHAFFGLSPREAAQMDPQQRMLLEVAWEAIEDAGTDPYRLAGTTGGVWVGIWSPEYAMAGVETEAASDPYLATGSAHSIAANRISYALDLRGPSIAIDTACSSSLVALHMATAALRDSECDLALAGGVNVVLSAQVTGAFARGHLLSPTCRCHSFGAAADGYVRAEGAGMVVLKRLDQALRDGDRIYASILGSAVNHDGRTNGLTAPSGAAQRQVIRLAQHRAGVRSADIDFVEAHGSGTPVGDLIEAEALGATLGGDRPADRPCLIGSVKSNLGHLEAAAGIAGLIKASLALQHRALPASLHAVEPNPRIDLAALGLRVQTASAPLTRTGDRSLHAGVSSFGFGGTNAHVVLAEPPATKPGPEPLGDATPARPALLPISARTPAALSRLAGAYRDLLGTPGAELADLCRQAGAGRAHPGLRISLVGATREQLRTALADLCQGLDQGTVTPRTPPSPSGPLVWVYGDAPPDGVPGLDGLLDEERFRDAVRECDAVRGRRTGWSVPDVLRDPRPVVWQHPEIRLPAWTALLVALTDVLGGWGVAASEIIGLGAGRIAARYAAGGSSRSETLTAGHGAPGPVVDLPARIAALPAGHLTLLGIGAPGLADELGTAMASAGRAGSTLDLLPADSSPGRAGLLRAVGRLYEYGHEPDWAAVHGPGPVITLPAYPWDHADLPLRPPPGGPAGPRSGPPPATDRTPDVPATDNGRHTARARAAEDAPVRAAEDAAVPGAEDAAVPGAEDAAVPGAEDAAVPGAEDAAVAGGVSPGTPTPEGRPAAGASLAAAVVPEPVERAAATPVDDGASSSGRRPAARGDRTTRPVVLRELAQVLEVDPAEVPGTEPFHRLGLDSLAGVDLHDRLQHELGVEFSETEILNHPTLDRLALFLDGLSGAADPIDADAPGSGPAEGPSGTTSGEPVHPTSHEPAHQKSDETRCRASDEMSDEDVVEDLLRQFQDRPADLVRLLADLEQPSQGSRR